MNSIQFLLEIRAKRIEEGEGKERRKKIKEIKERKVCHVHVFVSFRFVRGEWFYQLLICVTDGRLINAVIIVLVRVIWHFFRQLQRQQRRRQRGWRQRQQR